MSLLVREGCWSGGWGGGRGRLPGTDCGRTQRLLLAEAWSWDQQRHPGREERAGPGGLGEGSPEDGEERQWDDGEGEQGSLTHLQCQQPPMGVSGRCYPERIEGSLGGCCVVPNVLVASLTPYTVVDTPFPTFPISRLRDDRLTEERRESLRLRDRLEDLSSLTLEAPLIRCVSLRVLDLSWFIRSEVSR